MKKWKQISAFALTAVLTATVFTGTAFAGSPEFARTAEEWAGIRDNTMEYGELAALIHEYNSTVLTNERDYNENKNKTSNDIAQTYREQADAIRASMSGGDDPMSVASDAMSLAQAQSMDEQADDNVNDSEILKMGYDQTEATLVSAAETNMITYHQKVLDLELKKKSQDLAEANLKGTNAGRSVGKATDMDVLTATENLQNAEAAILNAEIELDSVRQKLCVMLGWRYDASPEIKEIPAADLERIASMDPAADKAKALENNYTLRINKRKLQNSTGVSNKEKLQMTIDSNEQQIGVALTTAYQSVLQTKLAYDQAVTDLDMETRNMQTADLNMQLGKISSLAYQTQQNTYFQKQTAVKTADMSLFQAMENYNWVVNGLATIG